MKYCVTSLMLGLCIFVCASAFSEGAVACSGTIRISTNFIAPDGEPDYCRTCCHRKIGDFVVSTVTPPTPSREWHLVGSGPKFHWTISPSPKGIVQGEDTNTLHLELVDNDFPTSFDITVVVTWSLCHDDGSTAASSATATMQFDAIEYVYAVRPTAKVDGRGDGALVDGYAGKCEIQAKGCRRERSLDLMLSANQKSESWQNEINDISMTAISVGSKLKWSLPHPYWYAKSGTPPDCCHGNAADYIFHLKVDECDSHTNLVSVYLPKVELRSRMSPRVTCAEIMDANYLEGVTNQKSRLSFKIKDFHVNADIVSYGKSQYKDKILEEEQVHGKQVKGVAGYEFEDLYSVPDALEGLGIEVSNGNEGWDIVAECDSNNDAIELLDDVNVHLLLEMAISAQYWDKNYAFSEYDAKRRVKFREAYLYHCCYESRFGPNPQKVPKSAARDSILSKIR